MPEATCQGCHACEYGGKVPCPSQTRPDPRDIIAAALAGGTIPAGPYQYELADAALVALAAAGFHVIDGCRRCGSDPMAHWCADSEATFE